MTIAISIATRYFEGNMRTSAGVANAAPTKKAIRIAAWASASTATARKRLPRPASS